MKSQPKKSGRNPVAPPAYRPQPVPKILQPKGVANSTAARPPVTQTKYSPVAPPVYHPETKKVLQPSRVAQQTAQPIRPSARVQHNAPRMINAVPRKDGSVIMRQIGPGNRATIAPVSARPARGSAVIQRAAKAEVKVPAARQVFYETNGVSLTEAQYDALQLAIDRYDIALVADFARGAAGEKKEGAEIGMGVHGIRDVIARHKGLQHFLASVIHPGDKKTGSRNVTYKGKSFMEILDMCAKGHECHNDLANALRECLSTLERTVEEADEE